MKKILILGSNDRATAIAIRLYRAGFGVCISEEEKPLDLYFNRTYSRAVYTGYCTIDTIGARTLPNAVETDLLPETTTVNDFANFLFANKEIPILHIGELAELSLTQIDYLIVARENLQDCISKSLPETCKIVGFENQEKADYTICTKEPFTGRVRYPFLEDMDLNIKTLKSKNFCRVHVPIEGVYVSLKKINDQVSEKEPLAQINEIPILAPESGRLVGLLNSGIIIPSGTDFAEIAPLHASARGDIIPAIEWSIAGGVLEAILYDINLS